MAEAFEFKPRRPEAFEGRTPFTHKHGWQHCLTLAGAGRPRLLLEGRGIQAGPAGVALALAAAAGMDLLARRAGQAPGGQAPVALTECGQVLVGLRCDLADAAWVGTWGGHALMEDGVGGWVDLAEPAALEPGDAWPWPVLGMPYHLSRRTHIYFQHPGDDQEEPPCQDRALLEALRRLEPHNAVPLVVTPWGQVLLKRQTPAEAGVWVFGGQIDEDCWFGGEAGER